MKKTLALASVLLPATAFGQHGVYDHRGQAGDRLGQSLSALGDIDGDGFEDYAAGAPYGDGLQPDAGYVVLYSGRTGATIRVLPGQNTGDRFGHSVAGLLGDVDGDQVNDLIVGAPYYDYQGNNPSGGAAYLFSGADGSIIQAFASNSGPGVRLGWSVAGPGDVDGDGWVDYAWSAPGLDQGWVEIDSGATHLEIGFFAGEALGDECGNAMAAAGDVDGDGSPDLVVGAPGYDSGSGLGLKQDVGRAYVLSYDGNFTLDVLFTHTGANEFHWLGHSVAGGEDLNGDLVPDIAVGVPMIAVLGPVTGRVDVVSGAGGHPVLYQLNGEGSADHFGSAVALLHDMDGDGRGEVAVGAPDANVGALADAGYAYVFSGASGAELFRMNGYYAGDQMGDALASARLLNADTAGDVIFGAPKADHNSLGANTGWARPTLGAAPYAQAYCTAKVNSAGCTPSAGSSGVPSLSIANNYYIAAANVLPGKPGMLIWSYEQKATPFYGGTLCVKAPIVRTPVQTALQIGPGPCDGSYSFHLSHAYMQQKSIPAGSTLNAQFWSRDNGFAPPNGIGLTNAVAIPIIP